MPMYTDGGSPQFSISGRVQLGSGGPVKFVSNVYQVQENISWIRNRHTLRFGFEHMDLGFFQSFGPPQFTFNGQADGRRRRDARGPDGGFSVGSVPTAACYQRRPSQ